MGLKVTQEEYDRWVREGLVAADGVATSATPRPTGPTRKKDLAINVFAPPGTWVIGVETVSIANSTKIKEGIGRKAKQKKVVFLALGRWHLNLAEFADRGIHAKKARPIVVKLCRLGGSTMDDDNLPSSMKYIRDAIADMLGSDDANPLISWFYSQEKHDKVGVRITIEKP